MCTPVADETHDGGVLEEAHVFVEVEVRHLESFTCATFLQERGGGGGLTREGGGGMLEMGVSI